MHALSRKKAATEKVIASNVLMSNLSKDDLKILIKEVIIETVGSNDNLKILIRLLENVCSSPMFNADIKVCAIKQVNYT